MLSERLLLGRARQDLHHREDEREGLAAARARLHRDVLVTREQPDRGALHRGGALESLRREHLQRLGSERRGERAESRALRRALLRGLGAALGDPRPPSSRLENVSSEPPGLNQRRARRRCAALCRREAAVRNLPPPAPGRRAISHVRWQRRGPSLEHCAATNDGRGVSRKGQTRVGFGCRLAS